MCALVIGDRVVDGWMRLLVDCGWMGFFSGQAAMVFFFSFRESKCVANSYSWFHHCIHIVNVCIWFHNSYCMCAYGFTTVPILPTCVYEVKAVFLFACVHVVSSSYLLHVRAFDFATVFILQLYGYRLILYRPICLSIRLFLYVRLSVRRIIRIARCFSSEHTLFLGKLSS